MTASDALLVLTAALFGLAFGSFANVVIYRVPRGQSVVSPPSACPGCGSRIKARHNVPLVGWFVLRGRCASCREPISARYPLVEALVGLLFTVVVARFGVSWESALLLPAAWAAVVLSAIDIDVRRLPRAIVVPWSVASLVIVIGAAAQSGNGSLLVRSLVGAAALGALYFGAFVAYPRGMGWGDVTMAPVIGGVLAFFGWGELAVGALAAFVWGLLLAVAPMVKARAVKGVAIPFGPSMFAGAATGISVGGFIASWYSTKVLGL